MYSCTSARHSFCHNLGRAGGREGLTLQHKRGIRANEHGTRAHTAHRPRRALFVDSNVTAHHNGVPAIPALALNPVDTVEEGSGGTVARVLVVDTLDVVVARSGEEFHEDRFGGFGFVDQGFGTDVETADGEGVDVVFFEEGRDD